MVFQGILKIIPRIFVRLYIQRRNRILADIFHEIANLSRKKEEMQFYRKLIFKKETLLFFIIIPS